MDRWIGAESEARELLRVGESVEVNVEGDCELCPRLAAVNVEV